MAPCFFLRISCDLDDFPGRDDVHWLKHSLYFAGEQRLAYNTAMRAFQDRFWEHVAGPSGLARLGPGRQRMSRAQWTRVKFGLPAQAALLQRAREITRGTGERDRQLRSFAQKTMLEAQALIKELEAREARVLAMEARLGLKPPAPDSNDPDKA